MANPIGWGYKNLSEMKGVKKDKKIDLMKDIISGIKNYPKKFYGKANLQPDLGKKLKDEAKRRAEAGENQNIMAENQ